MLTPAPEKPIKAIIDLTVSARIFDSVASRSPKLLVQVNPPDPLVDSSWNTLAIAINGSGTRRPPARLNCCMISNDELPSAE
jgi:hypothetical protein